MNLLDLTLPSPAENIALDEALLDAAESGGGGEVLRVWESPVHFVVLGAGCRAAEDVELERCAAEGVPVLRRCSGGGLGRPSSLSRFNKGPGGGLPRAPVGFALQMA